MDSKLSFGIAIVILGVTIGLLSLKYSATPVNSVNGKNLPPLSSSGLPLLGETLDLLVGPHKWMTDRITSMGPISRTYALFSDTIILGGQEGANLFYDESKIIRKDHQPGFLPRVLPDNVGSKYGENHKNSKKVVNAGLENSVIDRAVPMFTASLYKILDNLKGKTKINLAREFANWNFEALSYIFFSEVDAKSGIPSIYVKAIADALGSPPIDIPFTPFNTAANNINNKIIPWLEIQVQKHMDDPSKYTGDGLSMMLIENKKLKTPLTKRQLAFELNHMFGAGLIVNSPEVFFLQAIQRDPNLREKLTTEAKNVEYNKDKGITSSQVMKYPQMTSAYFETRRFFPGIKFTMGTVAKSFNYTMKSSKITYYFPKGWWVVLSLGSVHLDKSIHKNPELYDANRFIKHEPRLSDMTVVAHGGGAIMSDGHWDGHACPGYSLAGRLIKSFTVALLRDYEWELMNPYSPPTSDVCASATDGGLLKFLK